MPRVVVILPRLLEPAVGPVRRVELEAATVSEALAALLDRHPSLGVHLFEEGGQLRPHVMCFINGHQTSLGDPSAELTEGSEVTFLQAVSGG